MFSHIQVIAEMAIAMVIVTSCSGGELSTNLTINLMVTSVATVMPVMPITTKGTGDMMAAMMSIKITHSRGILDCVLIRESTLRNWW